MVEARINGEPASLDAAASRAAAILSGARLPVVAGLGTDVAGASAAILLAERLRAAYDHLASAALFADLDVLRQAGAMTTTPYVARQHADALLMIGADPTQIWPDLLPRLHVAGKPALAVAPAPRKLIWIAPPPGLALEGLVPETLETDNLHATLAALRARVAGRPIAATAAVTERLDALAAILKAATFGVAIWGRLDALAVEMATGLVIDLNKATRFTSLPLGFAANAQGVVQTSGWSTGFPVRTSFGRGYPEHDTWRFDGNRLIDSGEADAALWISAYSDAAPGWTRRIPFVAIAASGARFAEEPAVRIEVGRPGVDHDGADFSRDVGALVAREASHRSDRATVAAAIAAIAGKLPGTA